MWDTQAVIQACNRGSPTDKKYLKGYINTYKNVKGVMMVYQASDFRYDLMTYVRCGRSGLKLPKVSLGLWHNFGGVDQFENGRAMVRRAFNLGITHFDLANNYGPPPGSAEENFGKILKNLGRKSTKKIRP